MKKMTKEDAEKYLNLTNDRIGGRVSMQQQYGFYPDHYRMQSYCEGFLDGYEEAQNKQSKPENLLKKECRNEEK